MATQEEEALQGLMEAGGFGPDSRAPGAAAPETLPGTAGNAQGEAAPQMPGDGGPAAQAKEAPASEAAQQPAPAKDPLDEPITDWSKVDLGLGDDIQIDRKAIDSFGKAAVEIGITPRQAVALAKWQISQINAAREAMVKEGLDALAKEWGKEAGPNQAAVQALVARVDNMAGSDAFSRSLDLTGASCNVDFIKGLLALASLLTEDSNGMGQGQAMAETKEDALAGLKAVFARAR